jgi:uncharacterized Zn finger protein
MEALDGNALAGALLEHFGTDMTSARGTCAHCGAAAQIAALRVYMKAPGMVGRCPSCGNVAIVVVQTETRLSIYSESFQMTETATTSELD